MDPQGVGPGNSARAHAARVHFLRDESHDRVRGCSAWREGFQAPRRRELTACRRPSLHVAGPRTLAACLRLQVVLARPTVASLLFSAVRCDRAR